MTDIHAHPMQIEPGTKATLGRVLRDQRKTMLVALAMVVASLWILSQVGGWVLAGCVGAGVLLGLANHLATELWLLRLISSGDHPSRKQMASATLTRLVVLSVVAIGIAIAFWPSGIGLLLGLAIFRLVALVMTTLPLLKELKSQ